MIGKHILKEHSYKYYVAASVSLFTFLIYLASLKNGFVNWDDTQYLLENAHIQSIDSSFLRWAFFDFYADNWHPLTWLSHALDYAMWGWNPLGHHLTSNILHTINTFLVILLVVRLTAIVVHDSRFTLIAAGTTGVLFGLHPIHVESVAWVAERKDLLCALFYLLTIIMYLKYASVAPGRHPRWKKGTWYFLALCSFIFGLMSKPMAVSLPIVLLILDWYPLGRSWPHRKLRVVFVEMLPFMILSLASMMLTIMAQESGRAIQSVYDYPLLSRVFVADGSLFAYLGEMIFPVDLIPFYPYPEDISFSSFTYVSVIALPILITVACVVISRKQKWLTPVWGYYCVTLIPVLGIIQVGGQSMADRYTYLPSLGPFLIAGIGVAWAFQRINANKNKFAILFKVAAASVIAVTMLSMTYLTLKQIQIWRNSIDLWSYEIEKQPGKVRRAYMNRSDAYCEVGLYDKAIADYDTAVALWPFDADVYYGRGLVFSKTRQYDKAIFNFDTALRLIQDGAESYFGRELVFLARGVARLDSGQLGLATNDFKEACDSGNADGCQDLRTYGVMNTSHIGRAEK